MTPSRNQNYKQPLERPHGFHAVDLMREAARP
jgi:hypothetical protein